MSARILIVEDHGLLAQSLTFALESDGFEVEALTDGNLEVVTAAAERFQPTVTLLDLNLGEDTPSGLDLIPHLRRIGSAVVMMTGETDRALQAECLEAGALDIVSKSLPFDHLVATVREALELRSLITYEQREELLAELRQQRAETERREAVFGQLTRRETQVLGALMDGKSAEAIAEEWVVSPATVRSQIRSILQKLNVNSQLAAVAMARQADWIPPTGS